MPIEILMPALSPTMTAGSLTKWVKKEGEKVKPGQVIAEIETDKATMEVEAVDEGVLGKVLIQEGAQDVPVNTPIALLLAEGEDKKALEGYKVKESGTGGQVSGKKPEEKPAPAPVAKPAPSAPNLTAAPKPFSPIPDSRSLTSTKASPLAKRIAKEKNVDLASLIGTGPHGRILRADVEEATQGGGRAGMPRRNPVEFIQIPHTPTRKVIARRLLESKQTVPHFYLTVDCVLDNLLRARSVLNDEAKGAYKLSVNDFVIKAAAQALHKMPSVNVSWYDDAMVQYNNVDISVAVATPAGLITPIIRNADHKTLPQISGEMKDLAARARDNKLRPEEFQGGGFSISNLGMYGVREFAAIINPPQGAILSVGAGEPRAIVKDGAVTAAHVMSVTLSIDHRAIDGALGAEFLQILKKHIEIPVLLFV